MFLIERMLQSGDILCLAPLCVIPAGLLVGILWELARRQL